MLRKMRFDGPVERLPELVAAAGCARLELDDDGIDRTAEYGWPMRGDGHAFVLAVVDDDECSPQEVAAALHAAHLERTGEPGDWITFAGSYVYLPDGLEPEWYEAALPVVEALHAAEAEGAPDVARLRARVQRMVEAASSRADDNVAAFELFVAMLLDATQVRRET